LEQTELFTRSIGEITDIVSKEMFSLTTKGGDRLTLKPEGTAPAVRACIENNLFNDHPVLKLYYIGQNFRYERGQKGRYRQHQQCGIEVFGADDPAVDAEVILLAMTFFRELGVSKMELRINSVGTAQSRRAYLDILRDYVRPFLSEMSEEGQVRFQKNPLRMLDTKDEKELRLLADAPRLLDYLDSESRDHFEKLQTYLRAANVPFTVDHRLVRGFDYYTRTAFEIVGKNLGSQNALCGGGRYDTLVEECGGSPTPGIGFGLGMERCLISLDELGIELPVEDERPFVFVITLGDEAETRPAAVRLLGELRAAGVAADMDYRGGRFGAQVKRADELGAPYTLILGDSEVKRNVVQLRSQTTKEQREVALTDLIATLQDLGK
jgi:histidyl-tRNA synthetase